MGNVNIKINGIKYSGDNSETVLDICRKNDIEIPTLCYHEQLKPYGSCFLCTVEIKGARKKYSLSCSTKIVDGMEIQTDTKDLWIQRKMALELLLSNHYADCIGPCKSTCPSNVDVQGYIAAIAEGDYKEAIKIIKDDNPFPSVCGRVCTRPCEDECRRNLVDECVGIDYMKRYAADRDIADENSYIPPKKPSTGKKIAIIGAGPSGLSCAYYLAKEGHNIDIFEQFEKAGGMVRYGIPEYRQPNDVLDVEIKSITDLGPKIYTNQKLGKDFTINDLKNKGYDAIYIAIGAHNSMKMGIEGENANGIFGGIDLLRDVARGEKPSLGNDVIIIGGGNTAVDTARTSLRLGVRNVTMIYRRTINEMPAHQSEIEDAQEEGVKIAFLTNPIRLIKDKDNHVIEIECIKMELGEADSSGRRRPIPIDGSEFRIMASSVIQRLKIH
jgi:formate dehydrogenase major subunit